MVFTLNDVSNVSKVRIVQSDVEERFLCGLCHNYMVREEGNDLFNNYSVSPS